MALKTTEAIVLKAFNWSESSRTVHFFTRDQGKLTLVDKGGRQVKSKRGRLIPFARLEITYYSSERETTGYISDCLLMEAFSLEGDGSLGRLAYASAAIELLFSLLTEREAQTSLYQLTLRFLKLTEKSNKQVLPILFLSFFSRMMSLLGYEPNLESCVGCSKPSADFSETEIQFSPERGGIVCSACQTAGEYYIPTSRESHKLLVALQRLALQDAIGLPIGYREVTGLLEMMLKFVSFQTGIKAELKSLDFLEKLKNSNSSQ